MARKGATCLKTTRFYASTVATAHLAAEVFYPAFFDLL
jgi:hypothetical protein